jgi:hypothetical protein
MTTPALDFEQLAEETARSGEEWSRLDHAFRLLRATKDVVYARLVMAQRARRAGPKAEVEATVKGSVEWLEFVTALVDAETKANEAKLIWKLGQARYDGARSANAARNAELRNLGG